MVHVDKHYLLASLKILFSKNAVDEVTDETQLEFLIETELLGGNRWRDQIRLAYKDFMDKIKHIKISLKEFMINSGFLAKQRRLLSEFFLQCIVIIESKLQIKNIQFEAKSQLKPRSESPSINQRSKYLEQGRPKTVEEFFKKLLKIQNFWEEEPSTEDNHLEQIGLPSVKVVGDHEPNFGASENLDYRQQLGDPEMRMQHYNSLKYLKPRRYYILFPQSRTKIMLRMDYVDNGSESFMHIALYHHCSGTIDFINIKDKKLQVIYLLIISLKKQIGETS